MHFGAGISLPSLLTRKVHGRMKSKTDTPTEMNGSRNPPSYKGKTTWSISPRALDNIPICTSIIHYWHIYLKQKSSKWGSQSISKSSCHFKKTLGSKLYILAMLTSAMFPGSQALLWWSPQSQGRGQGGQWRLLWWTWPYQLPPPSSAGCRMWWKPDQVTASPRNCSATNWEFIQEFLT